MNTRYKILAEKYQAVLEQTGEPVMTQGANGTKRWRLNDKLHRVDGPAIEYADGNKYWYLNDKEYTEMEFWEHTPLRKEIEDLFR